MCLCVSVTQHLIIVLNVNCANLQCTILIHALSYSIRALIIRYCKIDKYVINIVISPNRYNHYNNAIHKYWITIATEPAHIKVPGHCRAVRARRQDE